MFKLLSPFIKNILTEAIEHGIAALCVFFAAHGVSQQAVSGFQALFNVQSIVAAILFVANYVYAAYRKSQPPVPPAAAHGATGLVIAALLLSGASAKAQTNAPLSTNVDVLTLPGVSILASSVPTNAVATATDIGEMLDQILPAGLSLSNFSSLNVSADGTLANGHQWGGMLAIDGLYSTTNSAGGLSLGLAGEYVGNDWFFAPVNVKISTTINIPVINQPLYIWASDSPSVRYRDAAMGSQTLVGGAFNIKLSNKIGLVLDGGRGENTQSGAPGFYFGGARIQIALK